METDFGIDYNYNQLLSEPDPSFKVDLIFDQGYSTVTDIQSFDISRNTEETCGLHALVHLYCDVLSTYEAQPKGTKEVLEAQKIEMVNQIYDRVYNQLDSHKDQRFVFDTFQLVAKLQLIKRTSSDNQKIVGKTMGHLS